MTKENQLATKENQYPDQTGRRRHYQEGAGLSADVPAGALPQPQPAAGAGCSAVGASLGGATGPTLAQQPPPEATGLAPAVSPQHAPPASLGTPSVEQPHDGSPP
jgi:hypothetical protein